MRKPILVFLFIINFIPLFPQHLLFVSPNGNDNYSGSIEKPFKSIEKAQDVSRHLKGTSIIYLRNGEYRLKSPLVFTAQDGNDNKKLILCAYPGETPIIKGSMSLELKWGIFKKNILQAKINVPIDIDMLIVNGEIRPMARFPNFDNNAIRFNGTSAEATSKKRIRKWGNPQGGYIHAMHVNDWGDFHYKITNKDKKGNLSIEGGWQNNRPYGLSKDNRMVENIFEELDSPGEWFYDKTSSTLYYYPLIGENINKAKIEVPLLKHLIEIKGTIKNPVKNIAIKGIELTQTIRTFMNKYEPLLRSDWTIYRGGAIILEGTEYCKIINCFLHNLGGNAIFCSNYNKNSFLSSNHIKNIGASAICFVGDSKAVRSPTFIYEQYIPYNEMDKEYGPLTNNYPSDCKVYDNLIHNIGLYEKQTTGVELSMCQNITVSHNSIYNTPRSGINVSEGTWGGHIIEYNDVFDTVKETGDHGSFNSWGRDRFWHPNRKEMNKLVAEHPELILSDVILPITIRNNRFRCDRGWDIDLDDGASNYQIYNNLCLNGGIKLREGFYRKVVNNILINNTFHPHVWFPNSGDIFIHNIVMSVYQPIQISQWGRLTDYNIFSDSIAYYTARKNNTDSNSIVAKIKFKNPQKGDFRVDYSQVEIFRLGFSNFDMNNFGVISANLKKIAETPKIVYPASQRLSSDTIITWKGWQIKNLNTLGERSATGMDSERGVYIIKLLQPDSPLKEYLQTNDVIIQLNNTIINNYNDLKQSFELLDLTKEQTLIIYRDQKKHTFKLKTELLKKLKHYE